MLPLGISNSVSSSESSLQPRVTNPAHIGCSCPILAVPVTRVLHHALDDGRVHN
jgi:hypothetical protein